MKITVNATRMELLRLRRRTQMAKRGHKLLKDKLDGLIQRFFVIAKEYQKLVTEIEEDLKEVFSRMILVQSLMQKEVLKEAVLFPKMMSSIDIKETNMMGVRVPDYKLELAGDPKCYGYAFTTGELDHALSRFSEVLPKLTSLASKNKAMELLSTEIAMTKRRVNALEHILIPELEASVKFIRMKLSEMERGYLTSLMKIKDIVRAR